MAAAWQIKAALVHATVFCAAQPGRLHHCREPEKRLARSRPTVVISMGDGSFARVCLTATSLALRCREREPSTSSAFGRRQRKPAVTHRADTPILRRNSRII